MTADQVGDLTGNQHGYRCPSCGSGERLSVVATIVAFLTSDGCDTNNSDTEWSSDSAAQCHDCGWTGTVAEFAQATGHR
jgi:hypothetical protein